MNCFFFCVSSVERILRSSYCDSDEEFRSIENGSDQLLARYLVRSHTPHMCSSNAYHCQIFHADDSVYMTFTHPCYTYSLCDDDRSIFVAHCIRIECHIVGRMRTSEQNKDLHTHLVNRLGHSFCRMYANYIYI